MAEFSFELPGRRKRAIRALLTLHRPCKRCGCGSLSGDFCHACRFDLIVDMERGNREAKAHARRAMEKPRDSDKERDD